MEIPTSETEVNNSKQLDQKLVAYNPENYQKNSIKQYGSIERKSMTIKNKKYSHIFEDNDIRNEIEKTNIHWNNSAQSWTREKSPSHSIPKSKRFINHQPVYSESHHPELYVNLTTNIAGGKKGISFAKSQRPKLFKILQNPSPNKYKPKRYLENAIFSSQISQRKHSEIEKSRQSPQGQLAESFYHMKGGTINKFGNHDLLYYPHTKKLNYNEKFLKKQSKSKKSQKEKGLKQFSQSFRVKINNNFIN